MIFDEIISVIGSAGDGFAFFYWSAPINFLGILRFLFAQMKEITRGYWAIKICINKCVFALFQTQSPQVLRLEIAHGGRRGEVRIKCRMKLNWE